MLEVVAWNPATEEATVISGFGAKANWYLNALGGGAEEIRISRDRFRPAVRRVEGEEATRIVADYEHRNRLAKPLVRAVLARLAGHAYDGSEEARRKLIDELPLVAFSRSQDQLAEAG